MSRDPYIPTVGSLPAACSEADALEWVGHQRQRHAEGTGFSFAIAEASTDRAIGNIGLWARELSEGRATIGYGVSPLHRRRGVAATALAALTEFAWTVPEVHRIELYIEPWNTASLRVAERSGYQCEGLLRSHQEIAGSRCNMYLYAQVR